MSSCCDKPINPLPEHVVGWELFEKLTAEWVRGKLGLKEEWEWGDYDFETIRRIAGELILAWNDDPEIVGIEFKRWGDSGLPSPLEGFPPVGVIKTSGKQQSRARIESIRKLTGCALGRLERLRKRLKARHV